MERILVLVDGEGLQRSTMEFATYIANLTQSKLTGLFLESVEDDPGAAFSHGLCRHSEAQSEMATSGLQRHQINELKIAFSRFCDNHQLYLKPETIEIRSLEEAYLETRFADLIIVSADGEFIKGNEGAPGHLAASILKKAECPVFIAPLTSKEVNEIVFTYDGSASSVFAIKQFTHLFPQLKELPATFLEVNGEDKNDIDFKKSISEYLKNHYQNINELMLKGRPEDELFSYFLDKKDVMVVMGAFGKKLIPSIFQRSTATLLLKTTSLPVFISHR